MISICMHLCEVMGAVEMCVVVCLVCSPVFLFATSDFVEICEFHVVFDTLISALVLMVSWYYEKKKNSSHLV